MADSPRVTELRREIAEMEANRDHLDPAMTDTLLASLREDLAEALGQAAAAPVASTPRPASIRAALAQEEPMPKKYLPQQKLEALHKRLLAARKAGKPTHKLAFEVRACCEEHGLEVPAEARLRHAKGTRKTAAKAPATAPHASASPGGKAAKGAGAPGAPSAAHHPAQGAGELHAPAPDLDLPPAYAVIELGLGPVEQIRQLQDLALCMLPDLQNLAPDEAARAHDEMDLLAQTLVLGGKLIARRSA